jgi:hypothetical protein
LVADSEETIKLNTMKKVQSVQHLMRLVKSGKHEYTILLNYGVRSSKHIKYIPDADRFWVLHYIDGSTQMLRVKDLVNAELTNIGKAVQVGALYVIA